MTDDEYLESVRKDRKKSVEFFSQANKHKTEIWVANEFLSNLMIPFEKEELVPVTDDPPDVNFRSAEFEIKEILDPGRRRNEEFKQAYEKAMAANEPKDLIEHYSPRDIKYTEIFSLVEEAVDKYSKKYSPDAKKSMDLLFYVNLQDTRAYIATPIPSQDKLSIHGFRSVSFVAGPLSAVLMVNEHAPEFLARGGPRIIRKGHAEVEGNE